VNGQDHFDALHFDKHGVRDHKVKPVSAIQYRALVGERKLDLCREATRAKRELPFEAPLICGFKKAGS
jgi:hypothetical protein